MSPLPEHASPAVTFGSHTDLGRRRKNNEDALRCSVVASGTPQESTLLIVSDGVGGLEAGEVASRTAVDTLQALLSEPAGPLPSRSDRRERIFEALRETDQRIRSAAEQPGQRGMGATVSLLWVAGVHAYWGQSGDSRIYLLRDGALRQVSHDQSPVGRLRAAAKLTESQARRHPFRHLIDQCLGGTEALEPETGAMEVAAGDVFLLCSDGLSDGLWDHQIAEGLRGAAQGVPPGDVARSLVDRANAASGNDNITAVVARVGQPLAEPVLRTTALFRKWLRRFGGEPPASAPAPENPI